jgi:hypothetical protein
MKNARAVRLFDAIAEASVPETISLLPRIQAAYERAPRRKSWRDRPALIVLIIALILSLLACATFVIGRSLGYIPGVGLVQNNSVLMLAKPVSMEQKGITITVEQLIADPSRTYLLYKVAGASLSASDPQRCPVMPILQLPNGSQLEFWGNGRSGSGMGMDTYSTFFTVDGIYSPLPAGARRVLFLPPCELPPIELTLIPAPLGFSIPVTEIQAISTSSGPTFPNTPIPILLPSSLPQNALSLAAPTPVPHGSGLYLDKVIETKEGYILIGNFTNVGDLPSHWDENWYENHLITDILQIFDSKGQQILFFEERNDLLPVAGSDSVWNWAIELFKPIDGPITISMPTIYIAKEDDYSILLDVGQKPRPGQIWEFHRTFNLGGYVITLEDVTMEKDGYTVRYLSDPIKPNDSFIGLSVEIESEISVPSSEETNWHHAGDKDEFRDRFRYDGPPPVGNFTILFSLTQSMPYSGPWKLTWIPPNR